MKQKKYINDYAKRSKKTFSVPAHKIVETAKDANELHKLSPDREQYLTWPYLRLGIPSEWWQTEGEGIKVAVLDTGIDEDHPDLDGAVLDTRDFTGDGIEDEDGHGTHCAGIIAARNNNVGFVGVAPKCELLIGKVLNNNGNGSYEWIARGVDWAHSEGADIISMSLGGPYSDQELFHVIHRVISDGAIIIIAAGNEGALATNSIGYPGKYGSVITVASHDEDGNPSGFSSRGGELDFMAPGSNIWSTFKKGGYAKLSGTSMATPFVAGLSALILSKHRSQGGQTPVDNIEDMRDHLMRMAAHPGYHHNQTGYGPLIPFYY